MLLKRRAPAKALKRRLKLTLKAAAMDQKGR